MNDARPTNQTERATYELRQRILRGALRGGTRLYEVAIAEELAISRTPAREAMSRLAEEGLLERARGGGFVVRAFSLADALDAIELRGVLEGTAARLAAERGAEPARMAALLPQLDACFPPDGTAYFDRYSDLNAAFHQALSTLSGSTILAREIERVRSLPFASPSAFVLGPRGGVRLQRTLLCAQEQHRALVAAIAAREGSRAEAIAREHAQIARANLAARQASDAAPDLPLAALGLILR